MESKDAEIQQKIQECIELKEEIVLVKASSEAELQMTNDQLSLKGQELEDLNQRQVTGHMLLLVQC